MGTAACSACVSDKQVTEEVINVRLARTSGDACPLASAPVVLASPGLEALARGLRRRLGAEEGASRMVRWEAFKSGDPNIRFDFKGVAGQRVVLLFDTINQNRLFEQLSLIQALQGFPVPDGSDAATKWKTYASSGSYTWGRVAHLTVVLPWYRPCQMERTSRWHLKEDESWTNGEASGAYLDVPTAQTLARLIAAAPAPPPGAGPSAALDDEPLRPLWRPPVELLFLELHEEAPVQLAVQGTNFQVRAERFVPYFLDKLKAQQSYAGLDSTYVLFPDHGAFDRYSAAVLERLKLASDHVLWIKKTRVGGIIEQEQKLFFDQGKGEHDAGEKSSFAHTDHVVIIDDFTNSGSTLLGAVALVRSLVANGDCELAVSIFVSHLVASYDAQVVGNLMEKLHELGPKCRFYTTNTIPLTTDLLSQEPQAEVFSIVDFLADQVG